MLEELHKNPELAADPQQQLQFKRLAQQQLLYQMALAAQAAAPPSGNSSRGDNGDDGIGRVNFDGWDGMDGVYIIAPAPESAPAHQHVRTPHTLAERVEHHSPTRGTCRTIITAPTQPAQPPSFFTASPFALVYYRRCRINGPSCCPSRCASLLVPIQTRRNGRARPGRVGTRQGDAGRRRL